MEKGISLPIDIPVIGVSEELVVQLPCRIEPGDPLHEVLPLLPVQPPQVNARLF